MKKISTATTKQSRNFSEQKLTIGLDLGDRSSWYCGLDHKGWRYSSCGIGRPTFQVPLGRLAEVLAQKIKQSRSKTRVIGRYPSTLVD